MTSTYHEPIKIKKKYKYLKYIEFHTIESKEVGVLIGRDNMALINHTNLIKGKTGQPIAL